MASLWTESVRADRLRVGDVIVSHQRFDHSQGQFFTFDQVANTREDGAPNSSIFVIETTDGVEITTKAYRAVDRLLFGSVAERVRRAVQLHTTILGGGR